MLLVAGRDQSLVTQAVTEATLHSLLDADEHLVVESVPQGRIARLLAAALTQMGKDNLPDFEPVVDPSPKEQAEKVLVFVKEHGGVRPTARATGIPKSTISRLYHKAVEQVGV
jgi:hypothetical protein